MYEAPRRNRIQESRISFVDGLLIRDPCDCLWYFARPCVSICLQNEVVVRTAGIIKGVYRMVRQHGLGSQRCEEPPQTVNSSKFGIRKVLAVRVASGFVDCSIMVIQSGLTILAQLREATHPAQRMEVAAVASGSNGISPERANPLFRRSLRPIRRSPACETSRTGVAGPVAKSVRSRVW